MLIYAGARMAFQKQEAEISAECLTAMTAFPGSAPRHAAPSRDRSVDPLPSCHGLIDSPYARAGIRGVRHLRHRAGVLPRVLVRGRLAGIYRARDQLARETVGRERIRREYQRNGTPHCKQEAQGKIRSEKMITSDHLKHILNHHKPRHQ